MGNIPLLIKGVSLHGKFKTSQEMVEWLAGIEGRAREKLEIAAY